MSFRLSYIYPLLILFAIAIAVTPALASDPDFTNRTSPLAAAQVSALGRGASAVSRGGGAGAAPYSSSNPDASRPGSSGSGASAGSAVLLSPHLPVTIPHLAAAPVLNDFLASPMRPPALQMLRVADFIERMPEDGQRPADPTVAYLGYTHESLFVAFLCRARNPKVVRAHLLARDSMGDDDTVQVMLDTFHDQRRAFVFQSNALGIQADALYTEQTGYDFSFDTVWDTWGRRTPWGYAVLMRIPFASLYFSKSAPGELRTWGIILERNQSQANEQDYWPRSNHNIAGMLTQDMEV
ncbi:MAG: carbohydrate binding family 9 domain-containing protein, partial [Acidobacteriota bacterium]